MYSANGVLGGQGNIVFDDGFLCGSHHTEILDAGFNLDNEGSGKKVNRGKKGPALAFN